MKGQVLSDFGTDSPTYRSFHQQLIVCRNPLKRRLMWLLIIYSVSLSIASTRVLFLVFSTAYEILLLPKPRQILFSSFICLQIQNDFRTIFVSMTLQFKNIVSKRLFCWFTRLF